MEDPAGVNRAEPTVIQTRRFWPPVTYALTAALCLGLLAFGILVYRKSTNRDGETTKPPNEPVEQTVRGRLEFGSLPNHLRQDKLPFEGTIVGDGDDRRRYIGGHPASPQRAIWHFDNLPQRLNSPEGDLVRVKLTCSIFRVEPGPAVDENGVPVDPPVPPAIDPPVPPAKRKPAARGLPIRDPRTLRVVNHTLQKTEPETASVAVRVVSHTCPLRPPDHNDSGTWPWVDQTAQAKYEALQREHGTKGIDLRTAKPGTDAWKAVDHLAEDFGYCEVFGEMVDLKETNIQIPAGVFRNALKHKPDMDVNGKPKRSLLSIYVKCETTGLLLGVTESDLYLDEKPAEK